MRFKEQVVFITGGTRGLGKAMAKKFLAEGAFVGVNGIPGEAVTLFEEEFKEEPVLAFNADVTNYEEMENAAVKTVEKWGKVDVLINNAGVVNALMPAEKMKKEEFDKSIDINLKGAFYASQIFGKRMIQMKYGRIINIASQVAMFGEKGFLPYAVSKSGLMVMARTLAYEWSQFGVTTCVVAPGFIGGGMNEGLIRKQAFVDYLSSRTPIGRMANVEEYVSLILFLASKEAAYINGETITMDGGMTGYTPESLLDFMARAVKGK
ncbi:MAG: SDR family oxidoreductase [Syntrophobacterales bacterium]|jgi:NAD(P)-dependent dehydrogenase (short-subunit alcohol dehydrogenase family)|nr:SDR family oxidoreductase [Syntrophobacterales bacterium]